jgi:hypothetical protein
MTGSGGTTTGGSHGGGGASAAGGAATTGGATGNGGASVKQDASAGAGGTAGTGGGFKDAAAGAGGTTSSGGTGGGSTSACPTFTAPPLSSLPTIAELPDPFMFMSGTRMTSTSDWPCRRQELSGLTQAFEYGAYPPKPDSVTGTLSGSTLSIVVQYGGKSITLSPTLTLPSGTGPFPVYVGLTGGGYDAPFPASLITPMGMAHIAFSTDNLAVDAPGKGGDFYTLYGTSVTTGVLLAWGWGVHRIVDALAQISTFDATKVVVHGFSRYGKGALVAGAFDERVALTIASSSGAGGIGSWRSADVQNLNITPSDGSTNGVQTLNEVLGESPHWFTSAFKNFRNKTTTLPFDGHSVAALVAPRPLLVTESEDDAWNNPVGCYTAAVAAHSVWAYLGIPDSMGFASHADGGHAFGEFTEATAFINKFILGKKATTSVMENPGSFTVSSSDIPWSAP